MAAGNAKARGQLVRVALVRERALAYEHQVDGPARAAALAVAVLRDHDREAFVCIHLNTKRDVLSVEVVAVGTLNSVAVHPREVWKGALLANAASVVVAHSHPSGHTEPSPEDLALTHRLRAAGDVLGVPLDDHLIVAGESWLSLRETTPLWAWPTLPDEPRTQKGDPALWKKLSSGSS